MNPEVVLQKKDVVQLIAHEMRHCVTTIQIANRFLREGIKADGDKEMLDIYIDILANNSKRIEQLIKKSASFREDDLSQFVPVDVCHLVDATLLKANDRIFLHGVSIIKSYTPGHFISGHEERLITAFLNLVINAIEAMSINAGRLWVTVYSVEGRVKVAIKDNGCGMESGMLQQIFNPDFSGRPGGRGLTHVKQILDEHGATISVNSKPGNGSSFIITFKSL